MIIVYTGNGKGKTSATMGQALRAHGQNLAVALGQFMKRPDLAGEQTVCKELFQSRYRAGGIGFLRDEAERPQHREAALSLLHWAREQLQDVDMLLLDEALYALGYTLITQGEIMELITMARQKSAHLVLSGRGLPEWLEKEADLITEMREIKHPFAAGESAMRGIEF